MPQAPSDERLPAQGVLKKYTNFVNGYQDRYFEIRHGKIAYYYSKADKSCCRGQFSLKNALIESHPDNNRDLMIRFPGDVIWYLQADDGNTRDRWIRALTKDYSDSSDYSSSSTHSHSRNPSVSSISLNGSHEIRLPLQKENGQQLFDSRIIDLQGYRSLIASRLTELEKAIENGENIGKIQSLEVRATRLAVTSTIDDIIELIRKGVSNGPSISSLPSPPLSPPSPTKEMINGKIRSISDETITHETIRKTKETKDHHHMNTVTFITSDGEEEFHDADEHSSLGSIEEGLEARERDSRASSAAPIERCDVIDETSDNDSEETEKIDYPRSPVKRQLPFGYSTTIDLAASHPMYKEIDEVTMQQLNYAMEGVDNATWTLFAEDGEMKMFKREIEMDGLPVDPLKALHVVKGVSALEYLHYFFDPRFKRDWDHTLDGVSVLDRLANDTVLLHQKHKTIWPAAPRESLFWSHIRRVDSMKSNDASDLYIVCNKDIVREDIPLGSSSSLRVKLTVSMVCETLIGGGKNADEASRSDIACRIIYVSSVHPGGWVPTAGLRMVYKREYPKFLRTFTDFVFKKIKGQQLAI